MKVRNAFHLHRLGPVSGTIGWRCLGPVSGTEQNQCGDTDDSNQLHFFMHRTPKNSGAVKLPLECIVMPILLLCVVLNFRLSHHASGRVAFCQF